MILDVMAKSLTTLWCKLGILAASAILFALIAVATGMLSGQALPVAELPDGRTIRLESYSFEGRTVRYYPENHSGIRSVGKLLPSWLTRRVKWLNPGVTVVVSPRRLDKPILSVAFSMRDSAGKQHKGSIGSRLVVADSHGQAFDPVINYMANNGVFEAEAFPRRRNEVWLRLMDDDNLLAEFQISNPCSGPHVQWMCAPLPLTVSNGTLEITLEGFKADRERRITQCEFLIRENGKETTSWYPVSFEVVDATGNHWQAPFDRMQKRVDGHKITAGFLGALWPEEQAWKLRVEFKSEESGSESNTKRLVEFLARPEQL